ncbi:MAG: S8 family serine peptidase, partial [Bacteroidota bacterium]
ETVIEGIQYVVDNRKEYKVKVINLSIVSSVQSPYWADPLNQAVTTAWSKGITVVAAAGNSGSDAMTISVPGNNPYVITVGAFTDNFSDFNPFIPLELLHDKWKRTTFFCRRPFKSIAIDF